MRPDHPSRTGSGTGFRTLNREVTGEGDGTFPRLREKILTGVVAVLA